MHSFVVTEDTFDVVQINGPDAERFLQGQLTADIAALTLDKQGYGACCDNKGRVIAAFVIIHVAQGFYLCMARGLGQILLTALQKYLPFYQCSMHLAEPGQQLFACVGYCAESVLDQSGHATLQPGNAASITSGWLCRLEGLPVRALVWCKTTNAELPHPLTSIQFQQGTLEQWEAVGLLNGHYPFRSQDSSNYTPQALHYDQNGYVSFSKGCYTGQEIVARMHYRGKLKKQLFLLELELNPKATFTGMQADLTEPGGHIAGRCLVTRSLDNLHLALIELAVEKSESLHSLSLSSNRVIAGYPFDGKVIQLSKLKAG